MVTTSFPSLDCEAGRQKGQTANTMGKESMGDRAVTPGQGWADGQGLTPLTLSRLSGVVRHRLSERCSAPCLTLPGHTQQGTRARGLHSPRVQAEWPLCPRVSSISLSRKHALPGKEPPAARPHPRIGRTYPSPWRRQWHPTPVLLPGKSHGWRSLVGCSP